MCVCLGGGECSVRLFYECCKAQLCTRTSECCLVPVVLIALEPTILS